MHDDFEERLRAAARQVPVPQAPAGLMRRVAASRIAGERFILPAEPPARSRMRTGVLAALLVSANAAALLLLFLRWSPPESSPATDELFASRDGLFAATAFAGQTVPAPAVQALSGVDGRQIVPRKYDYRVHFVDSLGRSTPSSRGSITIATATVDGVPAWRTAWTAQSEMDGQHRTESETLLVARGDLKPIARTVHVRPYRRYSALNIAQRFVGDSVLGAMTTDGGVRRAIAARLPAEFGPYIPDALAPFGLVGVPLSANWTRSLSVPGWAVVSSDVMYPVTLRVIGEERITTPAGAFDCWKVYVVAGNQRRVQWVRKSDGLAIRSYDESLTPKGHRQYELLNP